MAIVVMQLFIFIFVLSSQFSSHYREDSNFILLKLSPKLKSQDLSETFDKYSLEHKPFRAGFRMFGIDSWPIDFSENGQNATSGECRGTCIQGVCDFETSMTNPKAGMFELL